MSEFEIFGGLMSLDKSVELYSNCGNPPPMLISPEDLAKAAYSKFKPGIYIYDWLCNFPHQKVIIVVK